MKRQQNVTKEEEAKNLAGNKFNKIRSYLKIHLDLIFIYTYKKYIIIN
jgi:hypothetical protein